MGCSHSTELSFAEQVERQAEAVQKARVAHVKSFFADKQLFPDKERTLELYKKDVKELAIKNGKVDHVWSFSYYEPAVSKQCIDERGCVDWHQVRSDALKKCVDENHNESLVLKCYYDWLLQQCSDFAKFAKEKTKLKIDALEDGRRAVIQIG
jgi:hypothetical protein